MDMKYALVILLPLAVLTAAFIIYKFQGLKRAYEAEIQKAMKNTEASKGSLLTEEDIRHLPAPVQKYLKYTGVIGKEKVRNVKVIVEGEMKMDPNKGWVKFKAEQFNFFGSRPARLFFMQIKMFGIPVLGLHTYTDKEANMLIKAAGLITVLDARGPEMRIGDTITLFNDMCFFSPAALIDSRIKWETVDTVTAKAVFEVYGCKVSAILYFNDKGELVNFVSEDRYYIPMDGSRKKLRWSTPLGNYKERNGLRLPSYGEAIWSLPEGDYCYVKFTNIREVKYNCDELE